MGKKIEHVSDGRARNYLIDLMRVHFTDTTFEDYIEHRLAGDFAYQIANAFARQADELAMTRSELNSMDADENRNDEAWEHLAAAIHYPKCWDVAAYASLPEALAALYHDFKCSEQPCNSPAQSGADDVRDLAQARRLITQLRGELAARPPAAPVQPDQRQAQTGLYEVALTALETLRGCAATYVEDHAKDGYPGAIGLRPQDVAMMWAQEIHSIDAKAFLDEAISDNAPIIQHAPSDDTEGGAL